MRFLILALLLIPQLLFAGQGMYPVPFVYVSSGGSEDPQSFEAGSDGSFDTDTHSWSVTDAGTVINTSDSGDAYCGSYSLSLDTNANDTAMTDYVTTDLGSSDSLFSYRAYIYVPVLVAWSQIRPIYFDDGTGGPGTTGRGYIRIYDQGGGASVNLTYQGAVDSSDIAVTEGAWYRIEIDYNDASSLIRVYNAAGTLQGSEQGFQANSGGVQYIKYTDYSDGLNATTYIDDVITNLDNSATGAQTCVVGP